MLLQLASERCDPAHSPWTRSRTVPSRKFACESAKVLHSQCYCNLNFQAPLAIRNLTSNFWSAANPRNHHSQLGSPAPVWGPQLPSDSMNTADVNNCNGNNQNLVMIARKKNAAASVCSQQKRRGQHGSRIVLRNCCWPLDSTASGAVTATAQEIPTVLSERIR